MAPASAALVELLARHVPRDDKEREDLSRMRHFATSLGEPFSRSQVEAHFTGSAVVVDPTGTKVALLHHAKLKRWLQPGGHAEAGDGGDMEATALREAREETGCRVHLHPTAPRPLDVDIHTIPARKDEPEHCHLDVRYLFVAEDPEALAHDPAESFGIQWVSWDEALKRADEAPLRRMLGKAREALEGGGASGPRLP
ncbi:NUDIX hydrolase [Corallococcus sp. ZKHCc1 1396]|uniref:NUDIX hydrolase n=1 Tax=Corallococcus soli TaxID=2710757 RepID=A0ABR9PI15_9BACT|nr:NUDIX hydrolase [Corallococcus soli]MBE4747547.1 NUDIX hydrolase [Corallococcus soli]